MLFNEAKIILDLCGGTGAWSKPYKEAGYDVRLITLPEQDVIDYIPPDDVYGILAAPPCTEFSLARNGYPEKSRDFITGLAPVDACIRIVWTCSPIFWALENPIGLLKRWLRKPSYVFQPWWFGDAYTKKTALWGNFNKPKRAFYDIKQVITSDEEIERMKQNLRKLPSINEFTSGTQRERRAITPSGFTKAFFEANQ